MSNSTSYEKQLGWMAPFFTIWSGQAISLFGSQLVQFSLIWYLTETTGSATVLATATMVGLLPQVFLGPIAGALVDRWSRRVMMILADALVAIATLGLAIVFWMEIVQVWYIYLALFIRAAAGGFHWAAMQASTSLMVPKENLSRIQGINQVLNGALNIGSAPLAALLLGLLPMQGILAIDVSTALIAILPLCFIPVPQPRTTSKENLQGGKTSVWVDLKAGFKYVWSWPGLLMVMVVAMLINLLTAPAFSLIPILVNKYFGGGAMQLAWMETAAGLGIVVGGLLLGAWGGFRRRVVTLLVGLIFFGGGMLALGLVPATAFYTAVVITFLIGFSIALVDGPLVALVQAIVSPEMQGRIFSLVISSAKAMTPLGLAFAGPIADAFGVQLWYIAGGLMTLLLGIAAFFVSPVVNIEDGRQDQCGELTQIPIDGITDLAKASSD